MSLNPIPSADLLVSSGPSGYVCAEPRSLTRACAARGLGLTSLARAAEIHINTLTRIDHGAPARIKTFARLARALDAIPPITASSELLGTEGALASGAARAHKEDRDANAITSTQL